jgi:hypothetical protein
VERAQGCAGPLHRPIENTGVKARSIFTGGSVNFGVFRGDGEETKVIFASNQSARCTALYDGGRLTSQTPLDACIRYAESFALGVALRIATCLGSHHCQVAAMFPGIPHALLKQRSL